VGVLIAGVVPSSGRISEWVLSLRTERTREQSCSKRSRNRICAVPRLACPRQHGALYEWLHALKRGTLPKGPEICDRHHGNLGPTGGEDGRVKILSRDFDQTVIVNPAYDLVRLGRSLASSARLRARAIAAGSQD
jgi:Uncharacterized protein conserved in bacteria (DUF2252)